MFCATDEDLKFSVSKIKEAYEDYKKTRRLQTEFMVKHEKVSDGLFEVLYSDGTKIVVDYNADEWRII